MGNLRSVVLAVLLATLSGCSPYGFSKEVGDLDSSVSGLTASVNSGHQSLLNDTAASKRRDLIYHQRRVAIPPSCRQQPGRATEGDPPCLAFAVGGTPIPADPAPIAPKLKTMLAALKDYTSALAAVTKASDRAEFDKEVATLSKSIQGLVAATGVGATAAPVIGVGINLFGWLVGTALDQQRYEALRKAVDYVDKPLDNGEKPMQVFANALGTSLTALTLRRRNQLLADADLVRAKIGPGMSEETYRARLADLELLLANVDALRKTDPMAAAQGLAKAHEELVKAVNNPKIDFAQLVKTLGDLKEKVSALQSALEATTPAAGSSKKGA